MKTLLAALALVLLAAAPTAAQTVFNPTTVKFAKSADHSAQLTDGTNIVTGYRLKHYLSGANSPLMTVDLCKPVPDAAGNITVVNTSSPCPTGGLLFAAPLVTNTSYVSRVTAYGPGGESAVSAPSNPFVLVGAPSPIPGAPVIQ